MDERQETQPSGASRADDMVPGSDGTPPSASEIVGAEEADREARLDVHASGDRSLGGTGTHHRASFSDPLPAVGLQHAGEHPVDEATGQRVPGPGSPEWMERPVDQGGFGEHMTGEPRHRADETSR